MKYSVLVLALVLAPLTQAQEGTIVLSPFEVSSSQAPNNPPIVVRKRADFLLLEISLVNDTREPEMRRDEVVQALHAMVTGIPKGSKMELFTEEFTLTPEHYQIPLIDVADTSSVTLYAKVPLADTDDVGAQAGLLRAFVRSIKGAGRTEPFTGDLGLSIKNPEQFRFEVINAIATDIKRIREAFGDSFDITVTGLDARLQWCRASISDVDRYLPFSYQVFPHSTIKAMSVGE